MTNEDFLFKIEPKLDGVFQGELSNKKIALTMASYSVIGTNSSDAFYNKYIELLDKLNQRDMEAKAERKTQRCWLYFLCRKRFCSCPRE